MVLFAFLCFQVLTSIIDAGLLCDVCKEQIHKVDEWMASNGTVSMMDDLATILCQGDLAGGQCVGPVTSWQCQQVCELAVKTYTSMTDYLLIRYVDPEFICFHLDNNTFKCPDPSPGPDPTPVPNVITDNDTIPVFNDSNRFGYILNIPDLHWDPQYEEGNVANCGEPVCCRSYDTNHSYSDPVVYGGKYGIANESIHCDTPLSVIESMLEYITNQLVLGNNSEGINRHNLDLVTFVGDAMAHDVYNQSKEQHLFVMKEWTNLLHSTFDSFQIPVFLTMGNHEGLPVDNFNGPPTDDWFNEPVSEWINQWIDTRFSLKDTLKPSEVFASSGYYSSVIRPGFRLIAINSGYTANDNFYLKFTHWKDPYVDMGGQYKWLNATLHRAKYVMNESVVILMHHPISSAVDQFEKMYYELYAEYREIIVVILAGHTHCDHFHVLGNDKWTDSKMETKGNTPFTTWFSAGSVTNYGGRKPSFRVYQYDRNSYDLVNYFQYRFDTKRSNEERKPIWFKAYDAKSEYGLDDISAASMNELAFAMATNDTLWKRYQSNYYMNVPQAPMERNASVCNALSATEWQFAECTKHLFPSEWTSKDLQALY